MNLDELPAQPDQATLARGMADSTRHSGNQVIESETSFDGHLWAHHQISSPRLGAQDLFLLVTDHIAYGILVTQPTRDLQLINAAKKGFRLTPRAPGSTPR